MEKIRTLSDEVIDQIAAGEVIERPASVVKELIENSLDAGAKEIRVELGDYGKRLILVSDDGFGISEDDLGLAPSRHATSKISTSQDLWQLSTFGFRGEALSSIFAVGRCVISSRTAACDIGYEFNWRGERRPVAMSVGTRVEVHDLFSTIPARRKFLKSNQTELAYIREIFDRIALCNPATRFTLLHDGKTLEDYLPVTHLLDRVLAVMKNEIKDLDHSELIPLEAGAGEMVLQGVLWPGKITKNSNQRIFLFVNRRPIRDRLLMHAVVTGYQTLLPQGVFPIAVLFLDIESNLVDVNVHPAKSEVRFLHTGVVHDLVSKNIRSALSGYRGMSLPSFRRKPESGVRFVDPGFRRDDQQRRDDSKCSTGYPEEIISKPMVLREEFCHAKPSKTAYGISSGGSPTLVSLAGDDEDRFLGLGTAVDSTGPFSSLRIIGQAAASYIICEKKDALVVIDQHAAHERVKFERLRSQYEKGAVESQLLLVSELVELSGEGVSGLLENQEALRRFGWEIDAFGANSVVIKSVPAILGSSNLRPIISSLFSDLLAISSESKLEFGIQKVLATIACHSAIRFNQMLSIEEMKRLLMELDKVELISSCPHGRPILTEIPFKELAQKVHRG